MNFRIYLAASVAGLSMATMIATPAAAQQITTGIQGTVSDDAGNPISNAEVVVIDTRTGATRTLVTNETGSFTAASLTTGGPYSVRVSAEGYEGQTIEGVNTTLQGNTNLGFTLTSGSGDIIVTGTRVRSTLVSVGPGQSFGAEVVQNAPSFNRDVRDIIRIDPRVSLDRDDGGSGQDRISCLGGNDRGNAFTVDGISQGDVYGLNDTGFSARSSTPLPNDAIRETQVVFAPFDVDYSQFTGCAINVVTDSGSNRVRLGGFFEYSNSDLRGDRVADRVVAPIQPERRWGAYLGAPIIRDRLFIFGAYEHQEPGQSQDDGPAGAGFANSIAGVPVAAFNEISQVLSSVYGVETGPLVTSRPFSNDRYFGRLDWNIADGHRFEATYQRLEEGSTRADDFSNSVTNPLVTGLNTFYTSGTISNYYSGRLYSQWSDAFSTELRYSRSEVRDRQDPIGGGEAQDASPITRIVVGVQTLDGTTTRFGRVQAGPGFSRAANDLRTTIEQYRAVARLEAGAHDFKIGAELNRADLFNLFVQNATGTLYFRDIAALREGLLSTGTNTNPTAQQLVQGQAIGAVGNFSATGNINDAAAEFSRSIYSIFAQDDWEVSDRLGVVMGVRVDWYDGGRPDLNPNFVRRYGFSNGNGFSQLEPIVQPRVALTYDLGDFAMFSGAQLRAGVGVFSGGDPLVWFGNAFQNDGDTFGEGRTNSVGCPAGQVDVVVGGRYTGLPACVAAGGQTEAARGLADTQAIDPDIQIPRVARANIGFRAELNFTDTGFFSGWNMDADYIYSRFRSALGLVDLAQVVNPALGLGGFTRDGRPIYRSIDPTVTGCTAQFVSANPTPVFRNVNAACFNTGRDDELMLTNTAGYASHNASILLSKNFDGGIFTEGGSTWFSFGYAFSDSQDRRNLNSSTAGSNYDLTAAFDRQNPAASRSFYNSRHNISLSTSFREEFFEGLSTRLGFTFVARSGRPYSLTFGGGSVFNDSVSGTENALVYLPTGATDPNVAPTSNMTAVTDLANFASTLGCAREYIGRTIDRNTCSNDWYYDLDLSLSQELPGPGRLFGRDGDTFRLYATMDNFLNFLNRDWNIQRRRDFAGRQDIASLSGVDAAGRYIITGFNGAADFAADNTINVSSSVWRLKVGISYNF